MRGLYAITSQAICRDERTLLAAVAQVLPHMALVQYRDKENGPAQRERLARALLAACRAAGRPLIVNDDVELAARIGADGVHLGRSDSPLAAARARLGQAAVIGVTCGDSLARAEAAQAGGASYVAFGRFFASRTKPAAPPAPLALLGAAHARLHLPICAIGGITPANAGQVITAGADLVAAIDGLFGAADPGAAAADYARQFDPDRPPAGS
ncbi:MAG TPA: thiamine phosphate synthase [Solimonas sp.]|nr:thiamine phosphate synthase [Solimonas sp.]